MSRMCLLFYFNFPCSCIFTFFSFTLSPSSWYTMYSRVEGQISEPLRCPSFLLWVVFMPYFPVVYAVTCDNKLIWVELSWVRRVSLKNALKNYLQQLNEWIHMLSTTPKAIGKMCVRRRKFVAQFVSSLAHRFFFYLERYLPIDWWYIYIYIFIFTLVKKCDCPPDTDYNTVKHHYLCFKGD